MSGTTCRDFAILTQCVSGIIAFFVLARALHYPQSSSQRRGMIGAHGMTEKNTKVHVTDHPFTPGHYFEWSLESVPYISDTLVTRVYRCILKSRPLRLEITLTGRTAEMTAVSSWVSEGNVENTRKKKAQWAHDGAFTAQDWSTVLAIASGECAPLL